MAERYEIVEQTEEVDTYRIAYGVLVKVFKYEVMKYHPYFREEKPVLEKIGKKKFRFTEDFVTESEWDGRTVYKVGSVLFNDDLITYLKLEDYRFEIKTTGCCFGGCKAEFNELMSIVEEVVGLYE